MWKTIIHSDNYEINKSGIVRNKRTKRVTNFNPDKDGYYRVVLLIENKRKNLIVHRLLAECFIPNPLNKPMVNHKDANKQNNNLNNLEWVTGKENMDHAWVNGLMKPRPGIKHHNCKLTEKDIEEIKILAKNKIRYRVIGEKFGIHRRHVYRIIKGLRWKHKL